MSYGEFLYGGYGYTGLARAKFRAVCLRSNLDLFRRDGVDLRDAMLRTSPVPDERAD